MSAAAREDRAPSGEGRVLVGVIVGAHGIKGAVKIRCFTEDPKTVAMLGPLWDGAGRKVKLALLSASKGQALARIDGTVDRNAAEALKGTRLFAERRRLPAPGVGEFLHGDLIGLAVFDRAGGAFGAVKAVLNYGAGDVLEITRLAGGPDLLLPFTQGFVPEIDLAGGRLVIDPPTESDPEGKP